MDPLSIAASVAGILTAAAHIVNFVSKLTEPPENIKALADEIRHTSIIMEALQRFIDRSQQLDGTRASLVQLEDVVTILTQVVLVFSELDAVMRLAATSRTRAIESLLGASSSNLFLRRTRWARLQSTTTRLIHQLQQHKTSLSLLLSIFLCESTLNAHETATSLHSRVSQQLEQQPSLQNRLSELRISEQDCLLNGLHPTPEPISDSTITSQSTGIGHGFKNTRSSYLARVFEEPRRSMDQTFDQVLSLTRVYTRVKSRDIDGASTILTTRSHAWSILSGISLAEVSNVDVIKLPLADSDLHRFRALNSLPALVPPQRDVWYTNEAAAKDPMHIIFTAYEGGYEKAGRIPYQLGIE